MEKLYVGMGGAIGAVSRYMLGDFIKGQNKTIFPLGTFIINITGCLLIGLITTLAIEKSVISPKWRLALTTGFLGGYTTFSTFSWETVDLLNKGQLTTAILYAIGSITIGLIGSWLGITLARAFSKFERPTGG